MINQMKTNQYPPREDFTNRTEHAATDAVKETKRRLTPGDTETLQKTASDIGYDLPGRYPYWNYPVYNGVPGIPVSYPDPFLFPGYTAEDAGRTELQFPPHRSL